MISYPLAKEGRDDILRALEKPPSLALSRTQADKIVAFARKHYHRIGSLIVHQLTEKNIGRSTLKITRGFQEKFNIPCSGRLSLLMEPMNLGFAKWFEDERGRFSLEKDSWNRFARRADIQVGSVIILCITRLNGDMNMYFQRLEN